MCLQYSLQGQKLFAWDVRVILLTSQANFHISKAPLNLNSQTKFMEASMKMSNTLPPQWIIIYCVCFSSYGVLVMYIDVAILLCNYINIILQMDAANPVLQICILKFMQRHVLIIRSFFDFRLAGEIHSFQNNLFVPSDLIYFAPHFKSALIILRSSNNHR